MMKFKVIALAAATLIILGAGSNALAQPGKHPEAPAQGGKPTPAFELSEEQRIKFNALDKHHRSSLEPLRQQLIIKRAELQSLMIGHSPDTGKIISLHRELGELHGKLTAEHIRFRNELEKYDLPRPKAFHQPHEKGRGHHARQDRGGRHKRSTGYLNCRPQYREWKAHF
ncbi:MAG: periplasmic heavy metal sensor [Desulfovibrionaceae bacterium]|nr:periplasmic heavy metal sensor [Desulfovibrionaceae bacterium]